MYKNNVRIHSSADVQTDSIGEGTTIWQNVVALPGSVIGKNCNICAQCLIENDVVLGDNVTVKCGVYIWDGSRIGNDVFIGPNVTFSNDIFPRSKIYPEKFLPTIIEDGASIGAGAVLLPGVIIGRKAMIGAGSVLTHSVPSYAIVVGNPARIIGYVENIKKGDTEAAQATDRLASPTSDSVTPIGVEGVTFHRLKFFSDIRGTLSAGEFPTDIPFSPKRYFLVFDVPSSKTRGAHAHHTCHQFLVCVKGSCAVVADDGLHRSEVLLDAPNKGLYLPPMTWGVQYKYSSDAVLLVFASEFYHADDYIRNYEEFLRLAAERRTTENRHVR